MIAGGSMRGKPILALLLLLLTAALLPAHHSVTMYDLDNMITLKGEVTKIEWTNPHVFVHFKVAKEGGAAEEWAMELDPPVLLRRYGWLRSTVKVGDAITVTGGPAKTGAKVMRGAIVELADGTQLRVWSRV
jgi:hypothetical protein